MPWGLTIWRTDKHFDPVVPCEHSEVLDRQGHSRGGVISIGPKDPHCVGLAVQPGAQTAVKCRSWGIGSVKGDCSLDYTSSVVGNFQVLPI